MMRTSGFGRGNLRLLAFACLLFGLGCAGRGGPATTIFQNTGKDGSRACRQPRLMSWERDGDLLGPVGDRRIEVLPDIAIALSPDLEQVAPPAQAVNDKLARGLGRELLVIQKDGRIRGSHGHR